MDQLARVAADPAIMDWESARRWLKRVDIRDDNIRIKIARDMADASRLEAASDPRIEMERKTLTLVVPVRAVFRGGRTSLALTPGSSPAPVVRPGDLDLSRALRTVHRAPARIGASPASPIGRDVTAVQDSEIRRVMPLAFLAPDIQRAILERRAPAALSIACVNGAGIPLSRADQRSLFRMDAEN